MDAVEFTTYALLRMHQRDILEEEVREALSASPSKHKRRNDGRSEVRERIAGRMLLVIYRRSVDKKTVINAMWD